MRSRFSHRSSGADRSPGVGLLMAQSLDRLERRAPERGVDSAEKTQRQTECETDDDHLRRQVHRNEAASGGREREEADSQKPECCTDQSARQSEDDGFTQYQREHARTPPAERPENANFARAL